MSLLDLDFESLYAKLTKQAAVIFLKKKEHNILVQDYAAIETLLSDVVKCCCLDEPIEMSTALIVNNVLDSLVNIKFFMEPHSKKEVVAFIKTKTC